MLQMAHVFPDARVIYPSSPQVVPQEFLMIQLPPFMPTKVTPWLMLVLQLLNTPDLYDDQFVASTDTATGLAEIVLER